MNIDDAIKRLSSSHPITKEDEEVFKIAVDCMEFTKDFLPLNATPERMKQAINLLNSLEDAFDAVRHNNGYVYFTPDEGKLKEFKADRNRIDEAIERTKKYIKKSEKEYNHLLCPECGCLLEVYYDGPRNGDPNATLIRHCENCHCDWESEWYEDGSESELRRKFWG